MWARVCGGKLVPEASQSILSSPNTRAIRSYIAVDADGATFGLTMYKLGNQESDQIKQFDELWVSEPELRQNTLDFSDKVACVERSSALGNNMWKNMRLFTF